MENGDVDNVTNQNSRRTITKPARYRNKNFTSTYSCFFPGPIDDEEPSCFEETNDVHEWRHAIYNEIEALIKNET